MIYKIQTCNPNEGFALENQEEVLLWAKHQFFEKGISPEEFRRTQIRDIGDVRDIQNAVMEKKIREEKIREMMARMN